MPLGIMGDQLRVSLKPFQQYDAERLKGGTHPDEKREAFGQWLGRKDFNDEAYSPFFFRCNKNKIYS